MIMVNAAGCVCVQFCTCVEDSTSMLCSALLQLFTLLCAVVLVLRWRRCLVAGATTKTTGKRSEGVGRTKNSPGGGGGSK